jgi:hypothetical protein
MGEGKGVYRVLVGKPEGKRILIRLGHKWEDNIKMDLQEAGWGEVAGTCECGNELSGSINCGKFFD